MYMQGQYPELWIHLFYSMTTVRIFTADVCGFMRKQVQRAKITKKTPQHGNLSFLNSAGHTADHSKMYGKETSRNIYLYHLLIWKYFF